MRTYSMAQSVRERHIPFVEADDEWVNSEAKDYIVF
jgi:hypothetical protein